MSDIILIADKNGNPVGGIRANSKREMRANATSILRDRLSYGLQGTQFGGARDYYSILGYTREPSIEDYRARFERDPVGGRVVEFPPEETWRDTPTVKDGKDKDAKDDTEFCAAWSDFAERMRVYHYCQRVDTLAGVGRFGILLLGVAGSDTPSTEVRRVSSLDDILYLRPFSEQSVNVVEWQSNPTNPRFGLPHMYELTTTDMEGKPTNTRSFTEKKIRVHWSRVIHVAEGLLENEVFGRPRLQRVINLLDDILKVVGGSAEATWKLMRKGFMLNLDPEADVSDSALEDLEEQIEEYDHDLRRYLKTKGMTVTDLGSETVDPSGIFDVIVTLISIATRIPKRILLGSERGELASSQDAATWAGYIAQRQLTYAEPVILRPLIDRLIKWGALPKPTTGRYTCVWDALFETSDKEKADTANVYAQAIQKASAAVGHPVVTAEEFRGEWLPMPEKLPEELAQAREQAKQAAQQPAMPEEGEDVLEQVGRVVGNRGYRDQEATALVTAAARLLSKR